jgi:hypothetical protein
MNSARRTDRLVNQPMANEEQWHVQSEMVAQLNRIGAPEDFRPFSQF